MAPKKRGECRAAVQLLLLLQLISDTASTWQVIGYHTAKGDADSIAKIVSLRRRSPVFSR